MLCSILTSSPSDGSGCGVWLNMGSMRSTSRLGQMKKLRELLLVRASRGRSEDNLLDEPTNKIQIHGWNTALLVYIRKVR